MVNEAKPDSKDENARQAPASHDARRLPKSGLGIPFRKRQILLQIALGAVILVSGIAIGTGGTILIMRNRIMWRSFLPDQPTSLIIERWRLQYDLTDKQAKQIRDIYIKQLQARQARFEEMAEADQAEREEFVAAIKSILTPEHFKKWYRDFTTRTERYRRMGPRQPRGFPQGGGPGQPNPEDMRGPERMPGLEIPPGPGRQRNRERMQGPEFPQGGGPERPPEPNLGE